jgi:murein DD-endopeptidase MepM/ murein hydrolase activator NlpD
MSKLVAFEDMSRFSYGMEAISPDIRLAGVGGLPSISEMPDERLARCSDVRKADSLKTMVATLLRQAQLQDSTFNRVADCAQRQNARWLQRPSVWPTAGSVTSGFGYRIHPIFGESMFHNGIDICGSHGTPIHAVADGIVVKAEYCDDYGNMVIVRHPASGYSTLFGHMSRIAVSYGEKVKRGELIGYMGSTGRSTGNHLHFSILCSDQFLNPMDFLVPTAMIVD